MLFLGLREAKWGIWIGFMDYRLFHMDSMDLPSNQQTTIRDYLKPGSIVVFAIIVIIIPSHSSNAYKTLIASNKKTSFKPFRDLISLTLFIKNTGVFTGILVLILLSVVKILRQFIQLSVFIVLKNHLLFNALIFFTISSHFL